ncbi:ROK family protein [Pseudarthrobacter sp. N5]|uniref:ROK family protein n=1 Tax=Pseudarthrobacter sp. N5 TaxID=3418416 RepID=UPI003CF2A8DF
MQRQPPGRLSPCRSGPQGQAGEVGHVVVEPSGPVCSCGGRGCLETFAGQEAIFTEAGIPEGTASARLARLREDLGAGAPGTTAAVERAGHYLGIAAASTAPLMNLSAVVLGGHFTQMGQWIAPAVRRSLAVYAPDVVSPAPGGRFGSRRVCGVAGGCRIFTALCAGSTV